jgi:DNA-binding Lrp family transcriptional regulator
VGEAIDDKDRLLLAALTRDARESLVSLARRVGLSRTATHERLRRLERTGVIEGYTVRLAPQTAPSGVTALMAVTLAPGKRCDDVLAALSGLPELTSCHALAGPIDLLLSVAAADNAALSAVRERVVAVSGVATVSTHVVLATRWKRHGGPDVV